jgi:hypothetical protein
MDVYILPRLIGPMPMILIAEQQPPEHTVLSDALEEQLGRIPVPDRGECEDKGSVNIQPLVVPSDPLAEDDPAGESAHHSLHTGGSGGESQRW